MIFFKQIVYDIVTKITKTHDELITEIYNNTEDPYYNDNRLL